MDQTVFFNIDTANEIAKASETAAASPLVIPQGKVSSILIKLGPGIDARTVISPIYLNIPDVVPVPSPDLFGTFRTQMTGLLGSLMVVIVLAWILSAVLIALVFSMSVHERQRQMSVLRSLGATRDYVLKLLLTEGWLLAACAAVTGSMCGVALIALFKTYFSGTIKMPFLFPSFSSLVVLLLINAAVSLLVVSVAIFFQATAISNLEPAQGMRE